MTHQGTGYAACFHAGVRGLHQGKMYRKLMLDVPTITSTTAFDISLEPTVSTFLGKPCATPTAANWLDRVEGRCNFDPLRWLPRSPRWYLLALTRGRVGGHTGAVRHAL